MKKIHKKIIQAHNITLKKIFKGCSKKRSWKMHKKICDGFLTIKYSKFERREVRLINSEYGPYLQGYELYIKLSSCSEAQRAEALRYVRRIIRRPLDYIDTSEIRKRSGRQYRIDISTFDVKYAFSRYFHHKANPVAY